MRTMRTDRCCVQRATAAAPPPRQLPELVCAPLAALARITRPAAAAATCAGRGTPKRRAFWACYPPPPPLAHNETQPNGRLRVARSTCVRPSCALLLPVGVIVDCCIQCACVCCYLAAKCKVRITHFALASLILDGVDVSAPLTVAVVVAVSRSSPRNANCPSAAMLLPPPLTDGFERLKTGVSTRLRAAIESTGESLG